MSNIQDGGWTEYSKLVLNELERLTVNYETISNSVYKEFESIRHDLSHIKKMEENILRLNVWKDKVDEVISPTQLKELRNEVYDQKSKWTAAVAILAFSQVILGLLIGLKII